MFVRPTNPISHRLARIAFILATVGSLIVAVSGPVHRFLGLDIEAAIAIFRYGFYLTVAGVALGLATILPARPGDKRRGFVAAFLAIVIGAAGGWVPLHWFLNAQHRPAINDITTDTANPPPLVVTAQLRRGAPNPPAYPKESAALQRAAFPDIESVVLAVPPAEAFKRADRAAMALDWEIVARAPADGRLEAIATSPWFGFRDDIVVRIRAQGTGSRIDIRSKSRIGESDLGGNAERVRAFIARLKSEG
ncbi:MAG: hypothetical protein JWQ58_1131 [Reyranella sp.]|nr:hypothetical protein [Reyranella sp.]